MQQTHSITIHRDAHGGARVFVHEYDNAVKERVDYELSSSDAQAIIAALDGLPSTPEPPSTPRRCETCKGWSPLEEDIAILGECAFIGGACGDDAYFDKIAVMRPSEVSDVALLTRATFSCGLWASKEQEQVDKGTIRVFTQG